MFWKTEYSIGNYQIDSQHKEIFDRLEAFEQSVAQNKGEKEMEEMFSFLTNYVDIHFRKEEELIQKNNPQGYSRHKDLHDRFQDDIQYLIGKHNMVEYINTWLVDHILKEDRTILKR